MCDILPRTGLRDRILNDLRETIKQLYRETVKDSSSVSNRTWLCQLLVKNIDQVLRHGLKNLHQGYWRMLKQSIHPALLLTITQLSVAKENKDNVTLLRGTAWIVLSLNDGSLDSYIESFLRDDLVLKYYEDWSVLRDNDSAQRFLSLICGLDNIHFQINLESLDQPLKHCEFELKKYQQVAGSKKSNPALKRPNVLGANSSSSLSLSSPVDSGVVFGDSESDQDLLTDSGRDEINNDMLNDNIPVVRRRQGKQNVKKRVSFHEDCKSPEVCRRLKWNCEKQRYSWSGETDLNYFNLQRSEWGIPIDKGVDVEEMTYSKSLNDICLYNSFLMERGVPEGAESALNTQKIDHLVDQPISNLPVLDNIKTQSKSIIVKRFLSSIKKQKRMRKLNNLLASSKNVPICIKVDSFDQNLSIETDILIAKEMRNRVIKHIPDRLEKYVNSEIKNYFYLFNERKTVILSSEQLVIVSPDALISVEYENIEKIILNPSLHMILLFEKTDKTKTLHQLLTGDQQLTRDIMSWLEFSIRLIGIQPPWIILQNIEDLWQLKNLLIKNLVFADNEKILYYGNVYSDEESRPNSPDHVLMQGQLMFRSMVFNEYWRPAHFILQNGTLNVISNDDTENIHNIDLTQVQSCQRTILVERPHTFELVVPRTSINKTLQTHYNLSQSLEINEPKLTDNLNINFLKNKMNSFLTNTAFNINKLNNSVPGINKIHRFCFAASNESDMSDWLQAIVQASGGYDHKSINNKGSSSCSVVVSSTTLIVFKEQFIPHYEINIQTTGAVADIISFHIGQYQGHFYCIVEFDCMEATSAVGDVMLYFTNCYELAKFESVLRKVWPHETSFPSSPFSDEVRITHAKKTISRTYFYDDRFL